MKTKEEKAEIIKEIKEIYNSSPFIIFISLLNLGGDQQKTLKDTLKENSANFKVFKKTLIKKAIPELPIDLEDKELKQPFGLVFLTKKDIDVKVFKIISEFAEKYGLGIIRGILSGNVLTKEAILEIGKLPPLEVLRGKLILTLKSEIQKLIFVLKNPFIKLNLVVSSIKNKKL